VRKSGGKREGERVEGRERGGGGGFAFLLTSSSLSLVTVFIIWLINSLISGSICAKGVKELSVHYIHSYQYMQLVASPYE
jgi:hypothetical protein